MGSRTSGRPYLVDEDFVAAYIRDLQLRGDVGVLEAGDQVIPVYLLGQRDAFSLQVSAVSYSPGEIFTEGEKTNPVANTVLATTLALPAGIYDLVVSTMNTVSTGIRFYFQHRNDTDTGDIRQWVERSLGAGTRRLYSLAIEENERFRVLNTDQPGAGNIVWANIEAKAR